MGIPQVPGNALNSDMLKAISLNLLFDFMGVRVNAGKAEAKPSWLNLEFHRCERKDRAQPGERGADPILRQRSAECGRQCHPDPRDLR